MFHAKIVGFLINKDMFLNEENQTNWTLSNAQTIGI